MVVKHHSLWIAGLVFIFVVLITSLTPLPSLAMIASPQGTFPLLLQKPDANIRVDARVDHAIQTSGYAEVIINLTKPTVRQSLATLGTQIAHNQTSALAQLSATDFVPLHLSQPRFTSVLIGRINAHALSLLRVNPLVTFIQLDEETQVSGESVASSVIHADQVHNYGLTGNDVVVAILDSGVATTHPDLSDDIIAQHCFLSSGNCPSTGTTESGSAEDDNEHGTNVAGIITSKGVVSPIGIAPDAKIVVVKVLGADGRGSTSDIIYGLDWLIANQNSLKVNIINISIGIGQHPGSCDSDYPGLSASINELVENYGVAVFAAAGNQGYINQISAPACLTNIIAVGATYDSDRGRQPEAPYEYNLEPNPQQTCHDNTTSAQTITCFTNASPMLDIVAPGAVIESDGLGGGTSQESGTSQASPAAAATAALMLQANPRLPPYQIENILKTTGTIVHDNQGLRVASLINAANAAQASYSSRSVPDWCDSSAPAIRASVSSAGTHENNNSGGYGALPPSISIAISNDGRFVAFQSLASNLVIGDTNNAEDVFLYDRATCVTTRVSLDANGSEFPQRSGYPAISGDGRYVAFYTEKPISVWPWTRPSIFLYDRQTGKTRNLSIAFDGGEANSASYAPAISNDGRWVAFQSSANNLIDGNTSSFLYNVFIRDVVNNQNALVSFDWQNNPPVGGLGPQEVYMGIQSVSQDGQFVAFVSNEPLVTQDTNNKFDVYVRDRSGQHTELISVASDGTLGDSPVVSPYLSLVPSISGSGRYVAFQSDATNLVVNDNNGQTDIFVHDRLTGKTERISVAPDGTEGNGVSENPSISADGRFIAFISQATNLVPFDPNVPRGTYNIFVHDRSSHKTIRVSSSPDGIQANANSYSSVAISSDGHYVAFYSYATNLISSNDVASCSSTADNSHNCSDTYIIRISPQSFPPPTISAPGAAPIPNYYTTEMPILTWTRVSWAVSYNVQVARNTSFTNATTYSVGSVLSFTLPPPLTDGTYYWRVQACSSATSCSGWSTIDSFQIAGG